MTRTKTQPCLAGIRATSTGGTSLIFPLKHTEVNAKITGNVSRVEVKQQFENPLTQPLEAVYVFPLPDEAAVDEMEIHIGDRIIKGNIKKREEAKRIYEQAKQQGKTAGLLEQERDNIFTQSLANIKPGEQIDVVIRYSDSLKFAGGNYEFVFPMVVGPRFIPGNPIGEKDTDEVPDASRITPPVIPPETRSGHDINVTVEIDAGVPIKSIASPSHRLNITLDKNITRVQLSNADTIPNKDLIIRYQVSGDNTQATLLTHTDNRGTHFALYFIPALEYNPSEIVPKDVVFLMDTSGSQMGYPLAQSQALMRRFIEKLNPDDTFSIIDFSDVTTQLSPKPLPNTEANRKKAIQYINQLQANGGTYLLNGIRAVLSFPTVEDGRLRSIVLLTDGYIGNEDAVLAELQQELKPGNRLYSFGVGSSVNRFLLNRIAEIGRGTAQIVRYDEDPTPVAEKFSQQINNPVLINLEVKWLGKGTAPVIYPSRLPDLFANQPLVLFGKVTLNEIESLGITGTTAQGQTYEKIFDLAPTTGQNNPAIAQLWGRAKIKDLMDSMYQYETKTGVEEVTETALTYQLLSKYTAFVAVSEEVRVNPEGEQVTVNVPLEMPEGVSYEGIFGNVMAPTMAGAMPEAMILSAPPVPTMECLVRTSRAFESDMCFQAMPVQSAPLKHEQQTLKEKVTGFFSKFSQEVSPPAPVSIIQITKVTGLSPQEIQTLTQHLQKVKLPTGTQGEITLEFQLEKGRVKKIIIDEKSSSIHERKVIDLIKRSLLSWQIPTKQTGEVTLTLSVN